MTLCPKCERPQSSKSCICTECGYSIRLEQQRELLKTIREKEDENLSRCTGGLIYFIMSLLTTLFAACMAMSLYTVLTSGAPDKIRLAITAVAFLFSSISAVGSWQTFFSKEPCYSAIKQQVKLLAYLRLLAIFMMIAAYILCGFIALIFVISPDVLTRASGFTSLLDRIAGTELGLADTLTKIADGGIIYGAIAILLLIILPYRHMRTAGRLIAFYKRMERPMLDDEESEDGGHLADYITHAPAPAVRPILWGLCYTAVSAMVLKDVLPAAADTGILAALAQFLPWAAAGLYLILSGVLVRRISRMQKHLHRMAKTAADALAEAERMTSAELEKLSHKTPQTEEKNSEAPEEPDEDTPAACCYAIPCYIGLHSQYVRYLPAKIKKNDPNE